MTRTIPFPEGAPEFLEKLVNKVHKLAQKSENVFLDYPHAQQRMHERVVSIRQILDVLRNGKGIDGPTLDKFGDWRIKMKRYSAGRTVQVVVVVKEDHVEVVTVI